MKQLLLSRVFLLCLLATGGNAQANERIAGVDIDHYFDMSMEELMSVEISIATGTPQLQQFAPSVTSLVTAADIKEKGATTLQEALEGVPGLHVGLSEVRLAPIYSIRGIHTTFNPQVLFMINGIPFSLELYGSLGSLPVVPVMSIARIEVIRGPGSAVYGADAYAGVINVITKGFDDIQGTEVGMRSGSFGTHNSWVLSSGTIGKVNTAFAMEWLTTDGDDGRIITADAQSGLDKAFGTTASKAGPNSAADTRYNSVNSRLALEYEQWRLRMANVRVSDVGQGAGVATALDPVGRYDIDNYLLDLSYHDEHSVEQWTLDAVFSFANMSESHSNKHIFPAGSTLPIGADGNLNFEAPVGLVNFSDGFLGNPEIHEEQVNLEVAGLYTGFRQHAIRLSIGSGHTRAEARETKNFGPGVLDTPGTIATLPASVGGSLTDVSGTQHIYFPTTSRTTYFTTLQDEWQFARDWRLTSGLRYDYFSDFGDTFNPRLALVWQSSETLISKLLYGRAYRAPSFGELYFINNPVNIGNKNLQPETINTIELVFNYQPFSKFQADLSLFSYQAKDLIQYVADIATTTSNAHNVGEQDGRGFELDTRWKVSSDFNLSANYAWHKAEDRVTGQSPGLAPEKQFYLNARWRTPLVWHASTQLNWVADRRRVAGDVRPEIADYTTVDLTLRNDKLFKSLEIAVSVRNLFDENAREPAPASVPNDFPLAGRSLYGELSLHFGK